MTPPASQPDGPRVVKPFEGITVHIEADRSKSYVEIKGKTCLDEGFLEQIACSPSSREHESLVVIKVKPSQIHSALLMAGFESGKPGRWTFENQKLGKVDPTGEKLDVFVRYTDKAGKVIEESVRKWIRDTNGKEHFPKDPWVFGGSIMRPNPPSMADKGLPAGGEHYVADMSGSIIGLVTFGDEMIGFGRVLSDQDSVQTPEWEVDTKAVPPMDTDVTVIVKRFETASVPAK